MFSCQTQFSDYCSKYCQWHCLRINVTRPYWRKVIFIHRLQRSWEEGTGFTSSVRPSVRLSVRPSVCGQNRVRSVSPIILVGSISYLHILSSNFGMCVACKTYCNIQTIEFVALFFNLLLWHFLFMSWYLMWITSKGNNGAAEGVGGGGYLRTLAF